MAKEKVISALLVEPNKAPKMIELENTLEQLQKIVGGYIETYMPFEDEVVIICNEEGKINNLPLNRAVYKDVETDIPYGEKEKQVLDIVAGNFLICSAPADSDDFHSLPKDLAEKYKELFRFPEKFSIIGNSVEIKPFKPRENELER